MRGASGFFSPVRSGMKGTTMQSTIYHADVLGSMLRPHFLADARDALESALATDDAGAIADARAALHKAEDRAVDEALKR